MAAAIAAMLDDERDNDGDRTPAHWAALFYIAEGLDALRYVKAQLKK